MSGEKHPPRSDEPTGLAPSLERMRVNALVSLQLLFGKYRRGLASASERATPEESLILRDLEAHGLDSEALQVMLHGGHVVIDDPSLYERWIFAGSKQRLSSHHHDVDKHAFPDYGMVGPLVRQSLHGRTPQGTWIQWERTATAFKLGQHIRWRDLVHIKDYVVYRLTRKNVGPWGLSEATEKRPLYLEPQVSATVPLSPAVAESFVSALRAAHEEDRVRHDAVRDLFAAPPLMRLVDASGEPGGRRAGVLGGVPLAVHRVPVDSLRALAVESPKLEDRLARVGGEVQ